MLCLWCDDPTGSDDKLCPDCRAVHDHPPFHCKVPGHNVPTLGPRCAECELVELRAARRAAANAPVIEELKMVLNAHVDAWRKPWPGAEFGKTLVGNAIVNAIRDLGGEVTIPTPVRGETAYDLHMRGLAVLEERRRARASKDPYGDGR